MITRVTQRSIGASTLAGLQGGIHRVAKLQEQLSSGRQITKPSDDPGGTVATMQHRAQIRTNEQWARNANDGIGYLGTLDNALTASVGIVRRLRELALQGSNTATMAPEARAALAAEATALKDDLIGLANTRYLDRPVFGGTTDGSQAYAADGTYTGVPRATPGAEVEPTDILRAVGDKVKVRVDLTGPEVFGTGPTGLFAVAAGLATHLTDDPAALAADLDRLEAGMKQIQNQLATVGARYSRVEKMKQEAEDRIINLRGSVAEIESIDLPKTIMELELQRTAYEAALGAANRVITPSLVNFLQ